MKQQAERWSSRTYCWVGICAAIAMVCLATVPAHAAFFGQPAAKIGDRPIHKSVATAATDYRNLIVPVAVRCDGNKEPLIRESQSYCDSRMTARQYIHNHFFEGVNYFASMGGQVQCGSRTASREQLDGSGIVPERKSVFATVAHVFFWSWDDLTPEFQKAQIEKYRYQGSDTSIAVAEVMAKLHTGLRVEWFHRDGTRRNKVLPCRYIARIYDTEGVVGEKNKEYIVEQKIDPYSVRLFNIIKMRYTGINTSTSVINPGMIAQAGYDFAGSLFELIDERDTSHNYKRNNILWNKYIRPVTVSLFLIIFKIIQDTKM